MPHTSSSSDSLEDRLRNLILRNQQLPTAGNGNVSDMTSYSPTGAPTYEAYSTPPPLLGTHPEHWNQRSTAGTTPTQVDHRYVAGHFDANRSRDFHGQIVRQIPHRPQVGYYSEDRGAGFVDRGNVRMHSFSHGYSYPASPTFSPPARRQIALADPRGSWAEVRHPQQSSEQNSITPVRKYDAATDQASTANRKPPFMRFYPQQALHLCELAKKIIPIAAPSERENELKWKFLNCLEDICQTVAPQARLQPFGSLVTGFATASSDLDCVLTYNSHNSVATVLGRPVSEQTTIKHNAEEILEELRVKFQRAGLDAQLLTKTRIPIIKLVQKADKDNPVELKCDLGLGNTLAIRNSELLACYSRYDPRVRDVVVFIKWWAKKRRINSPYRGTLSSYGYALMTLHYLMNVVVPPVIPNLQLLPIPDSTPSEEVKHEENGNSYYVWFYKKIHELPPTTNTSNIGELLRGFFEYYTYKFNWAQSVISIRTKGGILSKLEKDWITAKTRIGNTAGDDDENEQWLVKDRYLLAIEDPFEITHNVGRTCYGAGVYRIREEFRRVMALLRTRRQGGCLGQSLFEEIQIEPALVRQQNNGTENEGTEEMDPTSGKPIELKAGKPVAMRRSAPANVLAAPTKNPAEGRDLTL